MRILFVLHYPGYLRYFDSVIQELVHRGHSIELVFDAPHKQAEGLSALKTMGNKVKVQGQLPAIDERWRPVARDLRRISDYVRYLDPQFQEAHYLRARVADRLPESIRVLRNVQTTHPAVVRRALQGLKALESGVPSDPGMEQLLTKLRPDVVIVSPLLTVGSAQVDLVRSAQQLGIPTMLAVASWDHLTTKGLIRHCPDKVIVWNKAQRTEAIKLHGVPADRVVVTGAQPFDRWFHRTPTLSRKEFVKRVGLPQGRPFVLFVGSTRSISDPAAELKFVEDWIRGLRSSKHESVRDIGVLVRPHPFGGDELRRSDFAGCGDVAVWPRGASNPVDDDDRAEYFDSIYHSTAVVGINTSAMIEAAVIGRPVLSIAQKDFATTQGGTLHFQHLLPKNGGFLRIAATLPEHANQLNTVLEHPEAVQEELRRFVSSFIRPYGLDEPATPRFANAVADHARTAVQDPRPQPWTHRPAHSVLWAVAQYRHTTDPHRMARSTRRALELLRRGVDEAADRLDTESDVHGALRARVADHLHAYSAELIEAEQRTKAVQSSIETARRRKKATDSAKSAQDAPELRKEPSKAPKPAQVKAQPHAKAKPATKAKPKAKPKARAGGPDVDKG